MWRPPHFALAVAALFLAGAARAATFTVQIGPPGVGLGTVVTAPNSDTTFRIDAATGNVTAISGAGRRLGSGAVRALVSISCKPGRGMDTGCTSGNVRLRIGSVGAAIGRAKPLTNFTVSMNTALLAVAPSGTSPIALEIAPVGDNATKTFWVGMDFPVAGDNSGRPSGPGEAGFFVNIVDATNATVVGDTDQATVTALRSITVAKTADLNFGRIALPAMGGGTVTLTPGGERVVTGGAGLPAPATSAAAFQVTGEGGQTFSASVPSTFQLIGPGAITVTTSTDLPATPVLSGTLGGSGALSFSVGGSFPISNTTATGAYSGTLTVSIDYN